MTRSIQRRESATGTGTTVRTSSPVLVGRSAELRTLVSVASRPGAVVFVEGEAGVGKTRLVTELLERPEMAAQRVLLGHCQPLREPFPYGVVLDALRGLDARHIALSALSPVAGALHPYLPELACVLPERPEPLGDSRAERHRLFRAVRELLDALGPALLVIEDLHWADDGSRQLLRFLMSKPPARLSQLVTYRREDIPGGIALGTAYRPAPGGVSATVDLQPLDADDVRTLTSAILGIHLVSAGFAARLHERTAGIPFVVEETLRALRNPEGAVRASGSAARRLLDNVEVPALLREAMLERLAGLSVPARRVTQAASVLSVPAPAELITTVSGLTPERGRAALAQALHANVLLERADCSYGFRHALAQQAVYRTLPGPDRERLHLRAAEALSLRDPLPLVQLAEHCRKGGARKDWMRYAESAADTAAVAGDAGTATACLRSLLDSPDMAPSDVDRLAGKLSGVAFNGLAQYEVTAALERLLTDPRLSAAVRGEVRLSLGLLLIRQAGGLAAGRFEIAQAIDELQHRPELRAKAMSVLAQPYIGSTPVAEHLRWLDEVDRVVDQTGSGPTSTSLLANSVASRLLLGDPAAWRSAERLPARVATAEEQRFLARAHCNVADSCSWIGYHRSANDYIRSGIRLAADCGAPFVVSTARATQAHVDWLTGSWDGLGERAQRLIDEYHDLLPVTGELSLVLGSLAVAAGEWDRAAGHLEHTGIDDPENAITPVVIAAHAEMIRLQLAKGNLPDASDQADRGLRLLRRKGVWVWAGPLAPCAVEALFRSGRVSEARALVEELESGITGHDAPVADAALLLCQGLLMAEDGRPDRAAELMGEAAEAYGELPAPYLAALATERRMRLLVERGLDDGTEATLARLAATFDTLGAARDAARCRHLLRAGGAGQPSRRGRRGYGDELSPRERDVARLVADGRTNREIADALFLSRRTVEQHVAGILRKLKLSSRTELRTH
ncbi:Predicted ATPase [Amycolatopsis marina]|uniref:Predicted ATPase n=1 Tax=Amycolatopsis marina TaxID=490629 RepID=A0A1I0WKN2_9PSEU|nr:LuxR family transcriptional regulator [Amycolatopsis marina]SFA88957.1 Predicted ATPase [Amycolatopsis marina]